MFLVDLADIVEPFGLRVRLAHLRQALLLALLLHVLADVLQQRLRLFSDFREILDGESALLIAGDVDQPWGREEIDKNNSDNNVNDTNDETCTLLNFCDDDQTQRIDRLQQNANNNRNNVE